MKRKTSTTKKPSTAGRESGDWLKWEDAILNHCRTLDTLAELLANTGRNDVVKVEMVNETGGLIKEEMARLKARVQARPGRKAGR
jgi:hypothetical protein